jgi:hypothetical protein
MQALGWLAFAAGVVTVLWTWVSVVQTLIVPRGFSSKFLLRVLWAVRAPFLFTVRRLDSYESIDRLLVLQGPTSLLILLITWVALFFLGLSLLLWPFSSSVKSAFVHAGSAMLTLGFAHPAGGAATVISFVAAATGLFVVALEIAYLPAIYGAFNRREVLVTTLQSRAGSPAWGPEILARQHLVGLLGSMPDLYASWEEWAADVAESHTNYPVLVFFRSPHPYRSWVLGLLAVLDSAAMYLALCPSSAPIEARLCLRMGFTCLRDIARTLSLPFDEDPFPDDPIDLSYDEFLAGVERLERVGFSVERSAEEAWPHFRGWRINYEQLAYRLADATFAAPGPWSGTRAHMPGMAIVPQRPVDRRPGDPTGANPERAARGKGIGF